MCSQPMLLIQPSLEWFHDAFPELERVIFPGVVDEERPRLIVGEP